MVRFLDKHVRVGQLIGADAPYVAAYVMGGIIGKYVDSLKGCCGEEGGDGLVFHQSLISEYSCYEIVGSLRNTVFSS